jgi:hypothetical protein
MGLEIKPLYMGLIDVLSPVVKSVCRSGKISFSNELICAAFEGEFQSADPLSPSLILRKGEKDSDGMVLEYIRRPLSTGEVHFSIGLKGPELEANVCHLRR